MKFFYTYRHVDPRDNKPFWVGKGTYTDKHRYDRSKSFGQRNQYHTRKINKIKSMGLEPIIQILQHFELEEYAFDAEKVLIKIYRELGYEMCNLTDGGEGMVGWMITEETRKKMGDAHRGRPCSEETKAKLRIANAGKIPSANTIAACIKATKGKKQTEEHKRKNGDGNRGRKRSEESKRKSGESQFGAKNHQAKAIIRNDGKVYGCSKDAARDMKCHECTIARANLDHKNYKYPHNGYTFKYVGKNE